jgi:hypothetical protein
MLAVAPMRSMIQIYASCHVAAGVSHESELDRVGGRWKEHVCDGLPKGGWGRALAAGSALEGGIAEGEGGVPVHSRRNLISAPNATHTYKTIVYQS